MTVNSLQVYSRAKQMNHQETMDCKFALIKMKPQVLHAKLKIRQLDIAWHLPKA